MKKLRYREGLCPSKGPKWEKAMATYSSPLAWKIPWMEEPGRLQSMGLQTVRHDWGTSLHFSPSCNGEGNGNPLQCSCLENPRDGGAWWAVVYGVTQSQTWLKRLSSSRSKGPKYINRYVMYLWDWIFSVGKPLGQHKPKPMRYHLTAIRMTVIKKQVTGVGEEVERLEPS